MASEQPACSFLISPFSFPELAAQLTAQLAAKLAAQLAAQHAAISLLLFPFSF